MEASIWGLVVQISHAVYTFFLLIWKNVLRLRRVAEKLPNQRNRSSRRRTGRKNKTNGQKTLGTPDCKWKMTARAGETVRSGFFFNYGFSRLTNVSISYLELLGKMLVCRGKSRARDARAICGSLCDTRCFRNKSVHVSHCLREKIHIFSIQVYQNLSHVIPMLWNGTGRHRAHPISYWGWLKRGDKSDLLSNYFLHTPGLDKLHCNLSNSIQVWLK